MKKLFQQIFEYYSYKTPVDNIQKNTQLKNEHIHKATYIQNKFEQNKYRNEGGGC